MELRKTDPEFAERFQHFTFDEVVHAENQQLDAPTRYLAIIAALIGCGRCGCLPGNAACRAEKRRHAGHGKGDRLSGYGLPRLRTDTSLFERDQ